MEDGRLCGVPYDGAGLVTTAWDIGIGDATAIWFMQAIGRELRAIDYYEASGLPLAHYVEMIKGRGYAYDTHILPHDAAARELGTGKSGAAARDEHAGQDRAQADGRAGDPGGQDDHPADLFRSEEVRAGDLGLASVSVRVRRGEESIT